MESFKLIIFEITPNCSEAMYKNDPNATKYINENKVLV